LTIRNAGSSQEGKLEETISTLNFCLEPLSRATIKIVKYRQPQRALVLPTQVSRSQSSFLMSSPDFFEPRYKNLKSFVK
jgi:hypothetical protein